MTAPIAEGLFRVDDERAVLFGSRRRSTGVVKFPAERAELFDGTDDIDLIELSTEGILFTFTTQEFAPPLPYKGKRRPTSSGRTCPATSNWPKACWSRR